MDIHTPVQKIGRIVAREAGIDVPACIAGVVVGGQPYRECAHAAARQPFARSYQPIEGREQDRRVGRCNEWPLHVHTQTDNRPGPRGRIVSVKAEVVPQNVPYLPGYFGRKRMINADKALYDELIYLLRIQYSFHGFQ